MQRLQRSVGMALLGIFFAIGCGAKPQDASAKSDAPMQLAEATDAAPAATPAGGATVAGSVKFSGTAPAAEHIKMDADPQCKLAHPEAVSKQDVVVNANGTLQHVFVYVKSGLEGKTFPAPKDAVKLDQHGCMYSPHVMGVQVNQPFEIVNDDATLHNVNCKPTKSKPFNLAQPVKGMKNSKSFTAPEVMVKCVCNVHPWMAAYVGVLDHPFYSVTDDQGTFSLAGLPAGTYTIEAWHEKYGAQTQDVTVGDGESKTTNFEFKAQ